ncbi:MAG: hypothetical protein ACRCZF_07315, partial [Gemmataceae bacterium]
ATGVSEFFDEQVGYVIPHTRTAVPKNDVYEGHWADPDDAAIIRTLQAIYADRATAEGKGQRAAARARTYTWRATGQLLLQHLSARGILRLNRS